MLFLMEEKAKEILRKAKYWVFDGTFEKCPAPFKQVYTIVAVFPDLPERQKSFICGIVFASNKTQSTYEEIFQRLKEELDGDIGVTPKEFRFDHEMAAIQSARAEFPDAEILTCNFHYTRNLGDYARSSKCSVNLYADPGFQRWLRALMGSSHLPSEWQVFYFIFRLLFLYSFFF
uniref:MULE transposase domain-containing protein n=1 Tax=Panagrolaimus superbus TaxID=310955 RepID=A0A914YY94_9BILA